MTEKLKAQKKAKSVLVVDDDVAILEMLQYILDREGFRTVKAADGKTALQLVASDKPDLIVLDIMLPAQSGYEVLKALQQPDTKDIPVVLITARSLDPQMESMFLQEPNVREYIKKPIVNASFVQTVRKALNPSSSKVLEQPSRNHKKQEPS